MMKYARVENGTVVEIVEARDPETGEFVEIGTLYHPAFIADLVPDLNGKAVAGGIWDGTAFGPLPATAVTAEDVKRECARRILAIASEWKQRNLIARALELTRKEITADGLSAAENEEVATIQAVWDRISALRTASDTLEADVASQGYTGDPAIWPGWPA